MPLLRERFLLLDSVMFRQFLQMVGDGLIVYSTDGATTVIRLRIRRYEYRSSLIWPILLANLRLHPPSGTSVGVL